MAETTIQAGQTVLLATFYVRDALCGLNACGVQEVIRLGPLTPVAHAPEEVAGVLNLRGRIVTIIDAALKLGFGRTTPNAESRIFIIEDGSEFLGLLVDRVGEVIEIEDRGWDPLPANMRIAQSRYFQGVVRAGSRLIALLDAPQILARA